METLKTSEEIAIAASESFKEREYWLNKLSGELARSSFPYDVKGLPGEAEQPGLLSFSLSEEDADRLLKISNKSDSRLHMILTAALIVLLHKYTENTDIIIGMPVERQEVEGEFINMVLALRNIVAGDTVFKDLLLQVRKTVFEAIEHQNYPVEALLSDLGLEHDEGPFPLFDVALSLENIQAMDYLRDIPLGMKFSFRREGESIEAELAYRSSLYLQATAERVCKHYRRVLHLVLEQIDARVEGIDILSEEEKNQLLYEFNDTASEAPREQTIYGLFLSRAEQAPNNDAVMYEGTRLTYRQLHEKASQLARFLIEKGVTTGTIVPMMVERSIEMIVGIFGILRAGAAYLPLDPTYPADRIDYMIKDSAAGVLLTTRDLCAGTAKEKGRGIDRILIDDCIIEAVGLPVSESRFGANRDTHRVPKNFDEGQEPTPGDLAYVIYTSGSTGKPKGVMIPHQSIVNTLFWRKNYYGFDERDRVLQIPSFSFDSSVEDIFTPLISGSGLVLIDPQQQFDVDYLLKRIDENRISHFLMVPNLYKTLLEEIESPLESLKTVTVAGDNFTGDLVKLHFDRLPGTRLFNEYGPTENSVCSTVYELKSDKAPVLIGKPIDNVACYILDKEGKCSPIGVAGRLWLAGAGLARGYLNAVYLTHDRFTTHTLLAGKRLYNTGDYAKWTADGNIEFLGRKDLQVKIRGFRIEMGEIENQLRKYDGIKDVIVTANEDNRGNKYLCAYAIMLPGSQLDVTGIMNFLSVRLPDYMVPAYYYKIDAFPLTPNGKIDKKRLPQPEEYIKTGVEYVAPRNELEEKMAEIWKHELDLDQVGINDNYFTIGGDSIKSIRLIRVINRELSKNLKIADLYVNNTIGRLSELIGKSEAGVAAAEAQQVEEQYGKAMGKISELKDKYLQGIRENDD